MKWLALTIAVTGLALPAPATTRAAEVELETILVVGERPGPAMWKVTWRDHVLWLMPTLAPLPRGITWRSQEVDDAIARSGQVFTEASLTLRMGGNGAADATVLAALQNPEGRTLREVLPPDTYTRFAALNRDLAGNDPSLERLRPFYAALELRKRALIRLQLDSDGRVHDVFGYLARKYLVPIKPLDGEIASRPATLAKKLRESPLESDIECARWQLEQLERELGDAVVRANAWALGDMAELKADWEQTQRQSRSASCNDLYQHLAPTERAIRKARRDGYDALRKALRRNNSSVALVTLEEMFDPEGVIARFRADGYRVDEP